MTAGETDGLRWQLGGAQKIPVHKAAELVSNSIRRGIVTGLIEQGALLPREAEMLEKYKVSRPTLREALRVLESEGFIRIIRGANGGARVQQPTDDVAGRYFSALLQAQQTSLADAFAARTIIGAPAAGLAASRRTSEDVAALRQHIAFTEQEHDDPIELWNACNQFHRLVVAVAGNSTLRLLSGLIDRILDQAACGWLLSEFCPDRPNTPFAQPGVRNAHKTHRALLSLIERGDEKRAEALWRRHLDEGARIVLNAPGAKTVVELLSVTT